GSFGNVVSGNSGGGILIQGGGTNFVQGNFIGTDLSGTFAVPNGAGISLNGGSANTIGGSDTGLGNLISGNGDEGIDIVSSDSNMIQGNFIGTDVSGAVVAGLGNGGVGVQIDPSTGNIIGLDSGVSVILKPSKGRITP